MFGATDGREDSLMNQPPSTSCGTMGRPHAAASGGLKQAQLIQGPAHDTKQLTARRKRRRLNPEDRLRAVSLAGHRFGIDAAANEVIEGVLISLHFPPQEPGNHAKMQSVLG